VFHWRIACVRRNEDKDQGKNFPTIPPKRCEKRYWSRQLSRHPNAPYQSHDQGLNHFAFLYGRNLEAIDKAVDERLQPILSIENNRN
jgi:hypothetical protein